MQKIFVKKTIVFTIIYLFIETSIQYSTQSFSTLQPFEAITTTPFSSNTSNMTTHYYAVIAACSQYKDPKHNLPKRPFPPLSDKKLMVLYESLLQSKNWDKNNIILLLNENATKKNIITALQNMTSIVGPEDYFLFSWNGHGSETFDTDGDEGYYDPHDTFDEIICPYDTLIVNDTFINDITDDELDSYLSNLTCKGMTLIFDCCLSGGMVDRTGTKGSNQDWIDHISTTTFSNDFKRDIEQPRTADVNGNNRIVLMSTHADFLTRGMYLTGFALTYGMAIACSNPETTDKNNDNIISTEEAFAIAKSLNYLQSSMYWIGVFTVFSLDSIIDRSPSPFLDAIKGDIMTIILIETIVILATRHFVANIPIMQDDYPSEFPLVVF
jgi:hypothetical protein